MKGKPIKGQLAQSTIERQQLKRKDTLKKIKWVIRLSSNRSLVPKDFTTINLTSLAAYENEKLKLKKLAYNTFKSHTASLAAETGISIDELRELLASLSEPQLSTEQKRKNSNAENIAKQREIIKAKDAIIENLTNDILDLRYSYQSLVETLRTIPTKDKTIRNTILEHNKIVGLQLVSVRNPVNAEVTDEPETRLPPEPIQGSSS